MNSFSIWIIESLQPYVDFCRIIHSEEKFFSVTFVKRITKFDGHCPNYCYLALKVYENDSVVDASCVTETLHQMRYCWFVWYSIVKRCIPIVILACYIRRRCQMVFNLLHLWKIHPCASIVERKLTDWREQVTTWRYLHGLCIITVILCVYKSNLIVSICIHK